MNINREDFHDFRFLEVDRWIRIFLIYFESKEEYEICANLHQLGYNKSISHIEFTFLVNNIRTI